MLRLSLSLFLFLSCPLCQAADALPDDVRYMLEDMYGTNPPDWPDKIYAQDINRDGQADWIAVQRGCREQQDCIADVFLCKAGSASGCSQYCYVGSKPLRHFQQHAAELHCESTC